MFGPKWPSCQSCGIPHSKDPRGGVTNADGSMSSEFSSNSYSTMGLMHQNVNHAGRKALVEGKLGSLEYTVWVARVVQ